MHGTLPFSEIIGIQGFCRVMLSLSVSYTEGLPPCNSTGIALNYACSAFNLLPLFLRVCQLSPTLCFEIIPLHSNLQILMNISICQPCGIYIPIAIILINEMPY